MASVGSSDDDPEDDSATDTDGADDDSDEEAAAAPVVVDCEPSAAPSNVICDTGKYISANRFNLNIVCVFRMTL
jgi:hypothetical protein